MEPTPPKKINKRSLDLSKKGKKSLHAQKKERKKEENIQYPPKKNVNPSKKKLPKYIFFFNVIGATIRIG